MDGSGEQNSFGINLRFDKISDRSIVFSETHQVISSIPPRSLISYFMVLLVIEMSVIKFISLEWSAIYYRYS